ncbi:SHOCT domain-containing protein [Segatella copri]
MQLRDSGVLTEYEFQAQKAKILQSLQSRLEIVGAEKARI